MIKYKDVEPFNRTINAVSKKAALEEYNKMAMDAFNKNSSGSADPFDDKPAGLDKATQQIA